jgi:hypothetical protein
VQPLADVAPQRRVEEGRDVELAVGMEGADRPASDLEGLLRQLPECGSLDAGEDLADGPGEGAVLPRRGDTATPASGRLLHLVHGSEVAAPPEQLVAEQLGEAGSLPLLGHHRDQAPAVDRRADHRLDEVGGEGALELGDLRLLALVDAHRMVTADGLAPAQQPHPVTLLVGGQLGIADEGERGEAAARENSRRRTPRPPARL